MKTDELLDIGLSEEQAKHVLIINGKDIEKHKHLAETLKNEALNLQTQLENANKEIENFKSFDMEGVIKSADEWKIKAENAQIEAEKKVNQIHFDYALNSALSNVKAKNANVVKALLDLDKITFSDGKLCGFDEQICELKTDNDYLFANDSQNIQIEVLASAKGGVKSGGLSEEENAIRKAAGLQPV